MNTFLSVAQVSVKEHYRRFAAEKVAPIARELESRSISVRHFLQGVGQSGYLGMTVPQEFGGQGAPFLNVALFVEAISEWEPGLGFTVAAHTAVIELIKHYGTDTQKSRYLPILARGEVFGSLAVGEDGAENDPYAVKSMAVRSGGQFTLSGKKVWVTNAELSGPMIVLARVADSASGEGSEPALLIVDAGGSSEIEISPDREKLGLRSAYTNDVEFDRLGLSAECLLGSGSAAVEQVMFGTNIAKVLVAASAIGLAQAALHQAVNYARTHERFGKSMGQSQAIQWKLADHRADTEAARLQTYRAAWSADESPSEFNQHAAMCKWYAAKVARLHSSEAVQILGSDGVAGESLPARLYRDAKMMEVLEGTAELQKLVLVKELDI